MNDLEMTKLCAEAVFGKEIAYALMAEWPYNKPFDPLMRDDQAMALVKKFGLYAGKNAWDKWEVTNGLGKYGEFDDLNRAIVECVAKVQKEKSGG